MPQQDVGHAGAGWWGRTGITYFLLMFALCERLRLDLWTACPMALPSHTGAPVPYTLLLADERGAEELSQLVAAFGSERRVAALKRMLGRLDVAELIKAVHHPNRDGGPRRCYRLTGNGSRWLASRSEALVEPSQLLAWFLARSEAAQAFAADGPPARAGGLLPMTESMWRG